eukprot:14977671-Alexandrium_andersonii.AAC.1
MPAASSTQGPQCPHPPLPRCGALATRASCSASAPPQPRPGGTAGGRAGRQHRIDSEPRGQAAEQSPRPIGES